MRDYLERPAGDYAELLHRGYVSSPDGVDPEAWRAQIRRQARQDKVRVITRRDGARAFALARAGGSRGGRARADAARARATPRARAARADRPPARPRAGRLGAQRRRARLAVRALRRADLRAPGRAARRRRRSAQRGLPRRARVDAPPGAAQSPRGSGLSPPSHPQRLAAARRAPRPCWARSATVGKEAWHWRHRRRAPGRAVNVYGELVGDRARLRSLASAYCGRRLVRRVRACPAVGVSVGVARASWRAVAAVSMSWASASGRSRWGW